MRTVVQRVLRAELWARIEGELLPHAGIGGGLVAFAGIEQADTMRDLEWTASKLVHLRVFQDADDKMNLSLLDLADRGDEPGLLLVPNFTVAGNAQKGRRPDFFNAMKPPQAAEMFEAFVGHAHRLGSGVVVVSGVFGAEMHVEVYNHGPVTICLDSRQ
ncbi:MAG: D-tyrosyl-tRNA(Tyr) deacylase, partial [Planctomycetota bacterium]